MKAEQLKKKYNVINVYRGWGDVPKELYTRSSAKSLCVIIPKDAKPDAIKNSSAPYSNDRHFLLFDIRKYQAELTIKD